jgi:hypothetical protein
MGRVLRKDVPRVPNGDERAIQLEALTRDGPTIRRAAGLCRKRVPLDRRIRLLGVCAGGLVRSARSMR